MAAVFSPTPISCGVILAYGLDGVHGNVDTFLKDYGIFCRARGYDLYNGVLFSDSDDRGNGIKLAEKLTGHGKIIESEKFINPTHGSTIRIWIWHPSQDCKKHIKELMKKTKPPAATIYPPQPQAAPIHDPYARQMGGWGVAQNQFVAVPMIQGGGIIPPWWI